MDEVAGGHIHGSQRKSPAPRSDTQWQPCKPVWWAPWFLYSELLHIDQLFHLGVILLMSCSLTSYVVLLKKWNERCPYTYLILSAMKQKNAIRMYTPVCFIHWSGKSSYGSNPTHRLNDLRPGFKIKLQLLAWICRLF